MHKKDEVKSRASESLLKSRLKKKLLNSIYFLNISKERNSKQTIFFIRVQKILFQCNTLLRLGAERNAFELAKKGLSISIEYELTLPALEFATILRSYYFKNGNSRKYKNYDHFVAHFQKQYNAEVQAIGAYQQFAIYYTRHLAHDKNTLNILKSGLALVEQLHSTTESSVISIIFYRLSVFCHDLEGRNERVYEVSEEALAYLRGKSNVATKRDFGEFYAYQLTSFIFTRDITRGTASIEECSSFFAEGTINWFIYKESAYLFYMHTRQYDHAGKVVDEVTGHKRFSLLAEHQREKWNIFMLFFLYSKGRLKEVASIKTKKGEELRKLLKRIPEIKTDKPGFGFSLMLIHILLLIEQSRYDQLTERMDGFKSYCKRHIKQSNYPKSNIFSKLILTIDKYAHNYLVVKVKGEKYMEKMKAIEISHLEANEGIQILPYEYLWEMVLESIRKNSSKRAQMK